MIGYFKKNIENYPRECFYEKKQPVNRLSVWGKGEKITRFTG